MRLPKKAKPKHFKLSDLIWIDKEGRKVSSVKLREKDSVENPSRPEHPIYGPGTVRFIKWADGGIEWDRVGSEE